MIHGSCECGRVQFEFEAGRAAISVCHCSQCRKTSGHLWAATRTRYDDLHFISDDTLTWYASSDVAKRGFCNACGSSLFYRMNNEEGIGIAAGSLDNPPEDFCVSKHIFVKDKGSYYDITCQAQQIDRY